MKYERGALTRALAARTLADTSLARDFATLLDSEAIVDFLKMAPLVASRRGVSVMSYIALEFLGMHGNDNRLRLDELVDGLPAHEAARQASFGVALVACDDIVSYEGNTARIATETDRMEGRFKNEPRARLTHPATAFLVTPRHIVTAGHTLATRNLAQLCFAFGYGRSSTLSRGGAYYEFDRSHIVRPASVVYLINDMRLGDIAVVELHDAVPSSVARPLDLAPMSSVRSMQEIAMLTHARGQPLTAVTRCPNSKDFWSYPALLDYDERFLYTNLDTFQGSSGSPVIDMNGRVIGVQVQGTVDHDRNGHIIPYSVQNPGSWASRLGVIKDVLAAIGAPIPPG